MENQNLNEVTFFFEKNKKEFVEFLKAPETTINLLNEISDEKELTETQFLFMGVFSYFVGIDFVNTNRNDITQIAINNIYDRFKMLKDTSEISDENFDKILTLFVEKIKLSLKINEAKESLSQKVDEPIINSFDDDNKYEFKIILDKLKSFVHKTIIPVQFNVEIHEILFKDYKFVTSQDLLKLNSIIQTHLEFNDKSCIKKYTEIYSHEIFKLYLSTALYWFNSTKFVVVYFDGILSVNECLNQKPLSDQLLIDIINQNDIEISDIEEVVDNVEAEEISQEFAQEVEFEEEKIEKTQKEFSEKPYDSVTNILLEISNFDSKEEAKDVLNQLFENIDLTQSVFRFVTNNLIKSKCESCETSGDNIIKIGYVIEALKELQPEIQQNYKESVELACSAIEEEHLSKIINYLNLVISDMIISREKEKQYLISQVIENQVTTYNHLNQILSIIETGKIHASSLSFVQLYSYLKNQTNLIEISQKSQMVEEYNFKAAIAQALINFFNIGFIN